MKIAKLENLITSSEFKPWHPDTNNWPLPRLLRLESENTPLKLVYGLYVPQPKTMPKMGSLQLQLDVAVMMMQAHAGFLLCDEWRGWKIQAELCDILPCGVSVSKLSKIFEIAFAALLRVPPEVTVKHLHTCELWLDDLPPRHIAEAINNGFFEMVKEERRKIGKAQLTRENWRGFISPERAVHLLHGETFFLPPDKTMH